MHWFRLVSVAEIKNNKIYSHVTLWSRSFFWVQLKRNNILIKYIILRVDKNLYLLPARIIGYFASGEASLLSFLAVIAMLMNGI